jgi:hypothetical protein
MPSCCTFAPSSHSYGATECEWWQLQCKAAAERASQHDAVIAAARSNQVIIPEDSGPGIAPFVALAAFVLIGTAGIIFI